MVWTWEEIRAEWLTADQVPDSPAFPAHVDLGHPPDDVVRSFNVVEAQFGRDWIEDSRPTGWRGATSTLQVISVARLLESLDGVVRGEQLISKIGQHDPIAYSEARALHLVRGDNPSIQAEYEHRVAIGDRTAVPDFRVRLATGEPWVYVEVAMPDSSDEQRRLRGIAERLASIITDVSRPVALDVEFQRAPAQSQVTDVARLLQDTCDLGNDAAFLLPDDLGRVTLNVSAPTAMAPATVSPSVTVAVAQLGHADGPRRSTVTVGYIDDRSRDLLRKEARQLPKEGPGLVMLDVSQAAGTRSWESIIHSRFQPAVHTRVSAVMLFEGYTTWINGFVWGLAGQLIENPHARCPLPDWLVSALRRWPSIGEVMASASRPAS